MRCVRPARVPRVRQLEPLEAIRRVRVRQLFTTHALGELL